MAQIEQSVYVDRELVLAITIADSGNARITCDGTLVDIRPGDGAVFHLRPAKQDESPSNDESWNDQTSFPEPRNGGATAERTGSERDSDGQDTIRRSN